MLDVLSFPTRRSSDLDLKKTNVWVNGKNVSIHTENGEIITDVNRYKIIYSSWDALIYYIGQIVSLVAWILVGIDRKSTRLNSSHVKISYAVFCLTKRR